MRSTTAGNDSYTTRGTSDCLQSPEVTSSATLGANHVTCFLTTESQLHGASQADEIAPRLPRHRHNSHKHSFDAIRQHVRSRTASPTRTIDSVSLSSFNGTDQHSLLETSRPITPGLMGTSCAVSAISSISSRRPSLTTSSFDICEGAQASLIGLRSSGTSAVPVSTAVADASSQLIMPSLAVPSRRPYTKIGRSLGKLKVLVAGSERSGKTTLIQSISRICEHIVCTDEPTRTLRGGIQNIYASSRPRSWWYTPDEPPSSHASMNRTFRHEDVLDRNICFVDAAPKESSAQEANASTRKWTASYVQAELSTLLSKPLEDADLQVLVSSGAHSVVDVVFYLIQDTSDENQFQEMRDLGRVTNVIPLIARSDEISPDDLTKARRRIREQLKSQGVEIFQFSNHGCAGDDVGIYCVSNATLPDRENWDASVLMDSEYLQPLVQSDIERLVDKVFSIEGCNWLRHSVARKVVEYRSQTTACPDLTLARRRDARIAQSPVLTTIPLGRMNYWERVLVSDWADGLRQSLESERLASMNLLAQVEPSLAIVKKPGRTTELSNRYSREVSVNTPQQDPLGLLRFVGQAKQGGKLTLELFSSVGAVGALAAVILKSEYACHESFSGFADYQLFG